MLPPAKVLADADVRLMVPVPVTVRFVDVAQFQIVAVLGARVHVPFIEIDLVFVFDESKLLEPLFVDESVQLNPPSLKDPEVRTKAPDAEVLLFVNASCNVTDPPGVLIVIACVNVRPALVIVWLPRPANVIAPVPVNVVPVPLIQLP